MVPWLLYGAKCNFILNGHRRTYIYQQVFGLVNVKLKWVKDRVLDAVVSRERDLKAVSIAISIISSDPRTSVPIHHLSRFRGQFGLSPDVKVSTLIRKYPTIFSEKFHSDTGGTPVPWFGLTPKALDLHLEELDIRKQYYRDIRDRLSKLLMLTKENILPLQTIDQVKWDLGLPYDYDDSLVHDFPDLFTICKLCDDRLGLKLLSWDDSLAISELEKEDPGNRDLSFPIRFTRGYGLKRKCMKWLEEWQKLPYTSPYSDASHLDMRTDVSEKRIVGVFHEFLHLILTKKIERKNLSNLRKPLALPQKFTKVFERHPGIFYLSKKGGAQTVVLREAYDGHKLVCKHPLVDIRERYIQLMRQGLLDRCRGLYKRSVDKDSKNARLSDCFDDNVEDCSGDLESDLFSEYETCVSEDGL